MSKKVLKTRTQFTSTLRNDLYAELQEMSIKTDIPISRLLDRAVSNFMLMQLEQRVRNTFPPTEAP